MRFIHKALLATILSAVLSAGAASQTTATVTQNQQPAPTTSTGGQQPPAAPSAKPGSSQNQQNPPQNEKEILKQEQSQRILGVVPQFGMTSRLNAPPLTTGEKFHLFLKSSFDPFQYAAAGLQAGLGQATNEFSGYGQGAAGYGKRYGATIADQVSSNFFSNFFYPTLLKEDPRYFRLGEGTIKHRILYSLAQEFVCHTDKGGRAFNWSNVLGAFTSGAISNAYYPSTDRGAGLTVSRSAVALLYGSAGGLIDEFWVDIHNKLFHKHSDSH
ncbi:MAG TPA: hypothetical protein VKY85_17315 [Candidatus Angelobacter sp.]|nr:hypothetical protein [Candidatus Angelobacter sp.]